MKFQSNPDNSELDSCFQNGAASICDVRLQLYIAGLLWMTSHHGRGSSEEEENCIIYLNSIFSHTDFSRGHHWPKYDDCAGYCTRYLMWCQIISAFCAQLCVLYDVHSNYFPTQHHTFLVQCAYCHVGTEFVCKMSLESSKSFHR